MNKYEINELKRNISSVQYSQINCFSQLEKYGNQLKREYKNRSQLDATYAISQLDYSQLWESMNHIETNAKIKKKGSQWDFKEYQRDIITACNDLLEFLEKNELD